MYTATDGVINIVNGARVVMNGEMVRNLCKLQDIVLGGEVLVRHKMTGENALFKVELDRMTEEGGSFLLII